MRHNERCLAGLYCRAGRCGGVAARSGAGTAARNFSAEYRAYLRIIGAAAGWKTESAASARQTSDKAAQEARQTGGKAGRAGEQTESAASARQTDDMAVPTKRRTGGKAARTGPKTESEAVMGKRKTKAGVGGADQLSDSAPVRNRGLSGIAAIGGPHTAHAATAYPGPHAGTRIRNATAARRHTASLRPP